MMAGAGSTAIPVAWCTEEVVSEAAETEDMVEVESAAGGGGGVQLCHLFSPRRFMR